MADDDFYNILLFLICVSIPVMALMDELHSCIFMSLVISFLIHLYFSNWITFALFSISSVVSFFMTLIQLVSSFNLIDMFDRNDGENNNNNPSKGSVDSLFKFIDNSEEILQKKLRVFFEKAEKKWKPSFRNHLGCKAFDRCYDQNFTSHKNIFKKKYYNRSSFALAQNLILMNKWNQVETTTNYSLKLFTKNYDSGDLYDIRLVNQKLSKSVLKMKNHNGRVYKFVKQEGKPSCFYNGM